MNHGMNATEPMGAFQNRYKKVDLGTKFFFRHRLTKAEQFLYKELFAEEDIGKELLFTITYEHIYEGDLQHLSIELNWSSDDGSRAELVRGMSLLLVDKKLTDSYWSFIKHYCGERDSLLIPLGYVNSCASLLLGEETGVRELERQTYSWERTAVANFLWNHWDLEKEPLPEF